MGDWFVRKRILIFIVPSRESFCETPHNANRLKGSVRVREVSVLSTNLIKDFMKVMFSPGSVGWRTE